jgi:hypothetical protein
MSLVCNNPRQSQPRYFPIFSPPQNHLPTRPFRAPFEAQRGLPRLSVVGPHSNIPTFPTLPTLA